LPTWWNAKKRTPLPYPCEAKISNVSPEFPALLAFSRVL
jgi:hypothetical protein